MTPRSQRDDTGNEARTDRLVQIANSCGWDLRQTVRVAVALGYLVGHWSSEEQREQEAGILQALHQKARNGGEV
jgi:hypothetical protein